MISIEIGVFESKLKKKVTILPTFLETQLFDPQIPNSNPKKVEFWVAGGPSHEKEGN